MERDVELLRHIAQVFVIAHDARNLHFPFSRLVTGQQVVKAMAHLAHEDCHSRLHVVAVEVESHLISLRVKRRDVFLYLFSWNEEVVEFPFNTHEEHAVYTVHILVEINDVALIVGDEASHL